MQKVPDSMPQEGKLEPRARKKRGLPSSVIGRIRIPEGDCNSM